MSKTNHPKHPKVRRFQLCIDSVETLEDVKIILDAMNIRIQTDDPKWESVSEYFCLEVVPRGYFELLEKIGHDGIAKLNFNEIETHATALLNELRNNEEKN